MLCFEFMHIDVSIPECYPWDMFHCLCSIEAHRLSWNRSDDKCNINWVCSSWTWMSWSWFDLRQVFTSQFAYWKSTFPPQTIVRSGYASETKCAANYMLWCEQTKTSIPNPDTYSTKHPQYVCFSLSVRFLQHRKLTWLAWNACCKRAKAIVRSKLDVFFTSYWKRERLSVDVEIRNVECKRKTTATRVRCHHFKKNALEIEQKWCVAEFGSLLFRRAFKVSVHRIDCSRSRQVANYCEILNLCHISSCAAATNIGFCDGVSRTCLSVRRDATGQEEVWQL